MYEFSCPFVGVISSRLLLFLFAWSTYRKEDYSQRYGRTTRVIGMVTLRAGRSVGRSVGRPAGKAVRFALFCLPPPSRTHCRFPIPFHLWIVSLHKNNWSITSATCLLSTHLHSARFVRSLGWLSALPAETSGNQAQQRQQGDLLTSEQATYDSSSASYICSRSSVPSFLEADWLSGVVRRGAATRHNICTLASHNKPR